MTATLVRPEWSSLTPEEIEARTADWTVHRKRQLLAYLGAQRTRQRIISTVKDPAALAQSCDPTYVITPAVDLVSRSIERTLREPNRNLLVTAPPQELKSTLCAVWTPIRALQLHPDWRVMVITYADGLAEEHSFTAREIIAQYGAGATDNLTGESVGDRLGLSLRRDRNAVGRWRINEGRGGLVAAGLGSTITGRSADLIIIDDPYKSEVEADSELHRNRVLNIYRTVIRTRRAPGCSVILVQTRWHEKDLAGHIIESERKLDPALRTWRYLNFPAISTEGVYDSLNREPGVALESARGRTAEEFEQTRRDVGERVFFALYQGVPSPPSGGLFSRKWFKDHRVTALPRWLAFTHVAVDPAETGENDEAGIIGSAALPNGNVVLTHDRSGHYTSAQWSRVAVDLAIEIGAMEIAIEAYTAGTTYTDVVESVITTRIQAIHDKYKADEPLSSEDAMMIARLEAIVVHRWRGSGDAVARSALLRQACETGLTAVLDHGLTTFENQAVAWQAGQHQPDRVAAAVIADARIRALTGRSTDIANPLRSITQTAPAGRNSWLARKVG